MCLQNTKITNGDKSSCIHERRSTRPSAKNCLPEPFLKNLKRNHSEDREAKCTRIPFSSNWIWVERPKKIPSNTFTRVRIYACRARSKGEKMGMPCFRRVLIVTLIGGRPRKGLSVAPSEACSDNGKVSSERC